MRAAEEERGEDQGQGGGSSSGRRSSAVAAVAAAEARRAEAVEALVAEMKAHGVTTDFRTNLFSAHQMGTCRMGSDPKRSVVGPTGEAWGCSNLFVCDASVFPTSSGVNPMLTTLSIADGIADHVAARAAAAAAGRGGSSSVRQRARL